MSLVSRSFFLVAAVAAGGGLLASYAVADGRDREPAQRSVVVDAPHAYVEAGRRTRVDAPFTNVDVDSDRRRVRVRAPFVDLDVRW